MSLDSKRDNYSLGEGNEFSIIEKWFKPQKIQRADVIIGIGDDAALLKCPALTSAPVPDCLAVSTDTLVAGIHFPLDTSAYEIGYKAMAVNLSDMAAVAAEPSWVSLSLALPERDEAWLHSFANGFFALCNEYGVQLVGGDITQGALTITVTIHGWVPEHSALLRSGAKEGDAIYVTGTLGDAALALKKEMALSLSAKETAFITQCLERPQPRVKEALSLRGIASAAIDISDGLAADLQHVLRASRVGAHLQLQHLPLSSVLKNNLKREQAWELALTGGDDYELCFTVPPEKHHLLKEVIAQWDISCTCIGSVEKEENGIQFYQPDGTVLSLKKMGYQHFEKI